MSDAFVRSLYGTDMALVMEDALGADYRVVLLKGRKIGYIHRGRNGGARAWCPVIVGYPRHWCRSMRDAAYALRRTCLAVPSIYYQNGLKP